MVCIEGSRGLLTNSSQVELALFSFKKATTASIPVPCFFLISLEICSLPFG
jgi:hypothetical protein